MSWDETGWDPERQALCLHLPEDITVNQVWETRGGVACAQAQCSNCGARLGEPVPIDRLIAWAASDTEDA